MALTDSSRASKQEVQLSGEPSHFHLISMILDLGGHWLNNHHTIRTMLLITMIKVFSSMLSSYLKMTHAVNNRLLLRIIRIGVEECLLDWLSDYLNGREMKVVDQINVYHFPSCLDFCF